jgi:hypothetical protein
MVDGDDHDWRFPGELLRKGSMKLHRFVAPLDDCLYPDAPLDEALLLDHAPEAEVTSSAVFLIDAGDRKWMIVEDSDGLRGNGRAAKN